MQKQIEISFEMIERNPWNDWKKSWLSQCIMLAELYKILWSLKDNSSFNFLEYDQVSSIFQHNNVQD